MSVTVNTCVILISPAVNVCFAKFGRVASNSAGARVGAACGVGAAAVAVTVGATVGGTAVGGRGVGVSVAAQPMLKTNMPMNAQKM